MLIDIIAGVGGIGQTKKFQARITKQSYTYTCSMKAFRGHFNAKMY